MPRILHLGLGNFHRAHQAWYTQRANALSGSDWRITAVSMTRPDLREALADGTGYTLAERGPDGLRCSRITLHDRILVAAEAPDAVIAAIADPEVRVVTLTVTERGYHLGPDGMLDFQSPAISADLAGPVPRTAIGMLAHGLAARAQAGLSPLTVLSCDNLSENGRQLRRAVADYAHAAAIAAPVADRFPNSMVDRITPATSDAIRAEIEAATGRAEPAPLLTEAFSDWVIEDDFAGPRPDWHRVGAILARDVAPYEARKLRCLNAAHSALAYGGLRRGHSYVHEALADPVLRAVVDRLWQDAAASLPEGLRAKLPGYLDALRARFSVQEMQHRLDQIAMDGSQKLPQRIAPILDAMPDAPGAVGVLAAWIAYLQHSDPETLARADPTAARLVRENTGRDALIDAALAMTCPDRDAADLKLAVTEALPDWMETDRHTG